MRVMKKPNKKAFAAMVSRIYSQTCSGIQVDVMALGKIRRVIEDSILAEDPEDTTKEKLLTFVNGIRKN